MAVQAAEGAAGCHPGARPKSCLGRRTLWRPDAIARRASHLLSRACRSPTASRVPLRSGVAAALPSSCPCAGGLPSHLLLINRALASGQGGRLRVLVVEDSVKMAPCHP